MPGPAAVPRSAESSAGDVFGGLQGQILSQQLALLARGARHRCGEEPDELHAGRAARIRRVIRCRVSSTPG